MFGFLALLAFVSNLQQAHTDGKGVPSCVFPFVFDGKSYKSCTKAGAVDDQLWCGTTANYDEDGQWKHCSVQEHGGNSEGKPCIFPFVYKNRTYYTCTKEDKGGFWCATTRNYDRDDKWSYCADTRLDANPKGPCVFPFTFNNKSYSSCTTDGISNKKPWCSLTNNYDADFQWTYCETTDLRPEPEAKGSSCIFPFTYEGNKYNMCTSDGMSNGTLWCATTSNYDLDKKWMYCDLTGPDITKEASTCVFPFIYNGKNYSGCTKDEQKDGKLWCATTSNFDTDKKWILCTITKTGCVFPFTYKGKLYESCTPEDQIEGKAWCATIPDSKTGLKWRLCNEMDCVFPFVFRGKSYHSCTRAGRNDRMRWCSLTANADTDMKWILC